MATPSPLLEALACEARCYVNPAVIAELPCETYNTSHWHRLARVWPFDLFARFEADDPDPETGADQVGLVVVLRHAGETIRGTSLWGMLTPELSADWRDFYKNATDQCRFLIDETCRPDQVRRYLEERLLTAQQLLTATYAEAPVHV